MTSSGSNPSSAIELEIGLPMLEGKNPQDVAVVFEKALRTRSAKVADAMGRLEVIPVEKRTESVKKFLRWILCACYYLETISPNL